MGNRFSAWKGCSLMLLPALTLAADVHQHGVGRGAVVIEGDTVQVEVTLPLADVLGSERPPADAQQHSAYAAQLARVGDRAAAVHLPEAAACTLIKHRRDDLASLFAAIDDPHGHGTAGEAAHEPDHHEDHKDHAQHSDEHHAGHDEVHRDFSAHWQYRCAHPDQLAWLDMAMLTYLPGLTLEMVLLSDRGQQLAQLTVSTRRLPLE